MSNQPIHEFGLRNEFDCDVDYQAFLEKEWNSNQWYSISAISAKLRRHRNTVRNWMYIGVKAEGKTIRLKMKKRPSHWYAKGQWIIDFFIKTHIDLD